MRISNCKGCGRIFNVLSDEQYCPNCQKKMDEKFDIVKRFVEDNPNVPVETVAKETDTSMKQINRWIREERLSFSPDSSYGIPCENCGRMIRTGRFVMSARLSSQTHYAVPLTHQRARIGSCGSRMTKTV